MSPRSIAAVVLSAALAGSALVARHAAYAQPHSREGKPLPLVLLPGVAAEYPGGPPEWLWRPSFRSFAKSFDGAEAEGREAELLAYVGAEARAHRQDPELLALCFTRARDYLGALGPREVHVSFCLAALQSDEWLFVFVLYPLHAHETGSRPYPAKVAVSLSTLRPRLW